MALGRTIHNILFRRSSTFFVTIVVGAMFFERAFDDLTNSMWNKMQEGVSCLLCHVLYFIESYARNFGST